MRFFQQSFRTQVRNLRNRRSLQRVALFGMTVWFVVLFSFDAAACTPVPKDRHVSTDELIMKADNIVLARVLQAKYSGSQEMPSGNELLDALTGESARPVQYHFEVLSLVKGKSQKYFFMKGGVPDSSDSTQNFNHHEDTKFWSSHIGRLSESSNCKVEPVFSVDQVYLVFLGKPYHHKSFELILNIKPDAHQDKWLSYVEAKVAERQ